MNVCITAKVSKLCPYADERDFGEVEMVLDVPEGDGPELHELARHLARYADQKLSHENFTRNVAVHTKALAVVSRWTTAGMAVVCEYP